MTLIPATSALQEELNQRAAQRAADFQRRRAKVYADRAAFAAARAAGLRRRHQRKLRQ